jgi:hypothetical protein
VPDDGNLIGHLRESAHALETLIKGLSETALMHRYATDKWTIMEILGHLIDDERIYVYRALRFARGDTTALPGFDQDHFARFSGANDRSVDDLLNEFALVRECTIAFFVSLDDDALLKSGIADGNRATVRALGYHITGHLLRHINVIQERYLNT